MENVESERADAGRGALNLRTDQNSKARTGKAKTCSADHKEDWQLYTVGAQRDDHAHKNITSRYVATGTVVQQPQQPQQPQQHSLAVNCMHINYRHATSTLKSQTFTT